MAEPRQAGGSAQPGATCSAPRHWAFDLALLVGVLAFGLLAWLAHGVVYFSFDVPISRAVQAVQPPGLAAVLGLVSWIGFPPEVAVVFGLIVVGLFLAGRRWEAIVALFAGGGAGALWFLVAPLVNRPRPSSSLVHVAASIPWGSFPSGHVLDITAFFGFLCYLSYVRLRPTWRRGLAMTGCGLLIVLIGLARIYSGEHWPSDVLGGYLLGGIWLAISVHLYRWGWPRWGSGRR